MYTPKWSLTPSSSRLAVASSTYSLLVLRGHQGGSGRQRLHQVQGRQSWQLTSFTRTSRGFRAPAVAPSPRSWKHAGSVLVVKAAGCYAHDCGFEARALHEVSFLYFLSMAEWNCICHVCSWYIHGLNMYVQKHKFIMYFSNLPVQPSWPYMQC